MKCAWNELLSILPAWMRGDVDKLGRNNLQELRLRLNAPPQLVWDGSNVALKRTVSDQDLSFVINTASRYSPWAAASAAQGYITAPGGHRIGICGEAVVQGDGMAGIRRARSLCIRVARDFPGLAKKLSGYSGSMLIIGRPGSGKTTLLRDLIRQRSEFCSGSIAVVDERRELFPESDIFMVGPKTDVLSGCSKGQGIEILLRTMGPETVAVDEITSDNDCQALIKAGWCGISLLATAHASSKEDLLSRTVYKPLLQSRLFDTLVILHSDKSWRAERMVS